MRQTRPKPLNRALSYMDLGVAVPEEDWESARPTKRPRRADEINKSLERPMRAVPRQTAACLKHLKAYRFPNGHAKVKKLVDSDGIHTHAEGTGEKIPCFGGLDLGKLGVPQEAWPWAGRDYKGRKGYTLTSKSGAASCLSFASFYDLNISVDVAVNGYSGSHDLNQGD